MPRVVLRRRWLALVVLISSGLFAIWWWRQAAAPQFNLLLITLDTTRADRLGAWGGPPNLTPILDQLAADGVVFERACCPVPLTLPSHTSLMTGLYPPEHGLRVNSGLNRLGDEIPVLSEQLRQRGYRTGAFVGAFVLDRKFGLDRGFDVYDDQMDESSGPTPGDPHGHKTRQGEKVVNAALSWLTRRPKDRFFCWVHLFDPHTPYDARDELFGDRFQERPYDAGIAYVDQQVGNLLDYLKQHQLDSDTLVVVVGDHGESLHEHQERTHGFFLYQSTLHVPLMLRFPQGNVSPKRIATPVSLVDLYPTLLSALCPGISVESSGRNLLPACRGDELPTVPLYVESNYPFEECGAAPLRGLVTDRWKYIRSPQPELYDLQADAAELRNMADEQSIVFEELEQNLQDLEAGFVLRDAPTIVMFAHERQKLASLGYAGGGATPQIHPGQLPDMKDVIASYNSYSDAQVLLAEGKFQLAADQLEEVVESVPNFFQAWYNLGTCREYLQDLAGAESAYRRAVEIDGNATAQMALGGVQLALKQPEMAAPHLETAISLQPDLIRAHFLLGEAFRLQRRWDEARKAYLDGLAIDPDFLPAQQSLELLPEDSN